MQDGTGVGENGFGPLIGIPCDFPAIPFLDAFNLAGMEDARDPQEGAFNLDCFLDGFPLGIEDRLPFLNFFPFRASPCGNSSKAQAGSGSLS